MTQIPFLNNDSRSKCCFAPIRLGWKTNSKTKLRLKIWICTRCKTRDIDIVSSDVDKSQASIVNWDQIDATHDESEL